MVQVVKVSDSFNQGMWIEKTEDEDSIIIHIRDARLFTDPTYPDVRRLEVVYDDQL